MAEKTMIVCGDCGKRAVEIVNLKVGGRTLTKDVCAEHLRAITQHAGPASGSPGRRAGRRRGLPGQRRGRPAGLEGQGAGSLVGHVLRNALRA